MNELNKAGDRFTWMGCIGEITRTAKDKSWADVFFTKSLHGWSKRMPLPLSPGAIPINDDP